MGTYWYVKDPESDSGLSPVFEDDFVHALFSIAKKHGLKITDKMILDEVYKKDKTKKPRKINSRGR